MSKRGQKKTTQKIDMSPKGGHPIFKAIRKLKTEGDIREFLEDYIAHLRKNDPRVKERRPLAMRRLGRELSAALGHCCDDTIALWRRAAGSNIPVGIIF